MAGKLEAVTRAKQNEFGEFDLIEMFNAGLVAEEMFLYPDYEKARLFLTEVAQLHAVASRQTAALAVAIARHIGRGMSIYDIQGAHTHPAEESEATC